MRHVTLKEVLRSVVIPKEGMSGTSWTKPSFGMAPTVTISTEDKGVQFYSQCHTKECLTWLVPAKPSFSIATTLDFTVQFNVTWLICRLHQIHELSCHRPGSGSF